MARVRDVVRVLAWVVAATVLVLPLVQPGGLLRAGPALAASAMSLTGSVDGLRPGVPAELVLRVANASDRPAVVGRLRAHVIGGGVPGCPATALRITAWSGELVVPARGAASQALRVLVDRDARCDGVTWSLAYEASGR